MLKKLSFGLLLFVPFLTQCTTSTKVSANDLKAPFIDHRSEVEGCYEKVLKKQPDLGTGIVEMKFIINDEGKTSKTLFLKKNSTLNNKLLNSCLKRVVGTWQFPKGKNLQVVYPFQFENNAAGDESKAPAKTDDMDIINTTPPEEGSGDDSETPAE